MKPYVYKESGYWKFYCPYLKIDCLFPIWRDAFDRAVICCAMHYDADPEH